MIKIKVSYTEEKELKSLLESLRGHIKTYKQPNNQKGSFKKAYIDAEFVTKKAEKG